MHRKERRFPLFSKKGKATLCVQPHKGFEVRAGRPTSYRSVWVYSSTIIAQTCAPKPFALACPVRGPQPLLLTLKK